VRRVLTVQGDREVQATAHLKSIRCSVYGVIENHLSPALLNNKVTYQPIIYLADPFAKERHGLRVMCWCMYLSSIAFEGSLFTHFTCSAMWIELLSTPVPRINAIHVHQPLLEKSDNCLAFEVIICKRITIILQLPMLRIRLFVLVSRKNTDIRGSVRLHSSESGRFVWYMSKEGAWVMLKRSYLVFLRYLKYSRTMQHSWENW
jgi:hypothetical protein